MNLQAQAHAVIKRATETLRSNLVLSQNDIYQTIKALGVPGGLSIVHNLERGERVPSSRLPSALTLLALGSLGLDLNELSRNIFKK